MVLAGFSHHMKGLLSYTGTDDYPIKTFLMQHTRSKSLLFMFEKMAFWPFQARLLLDLIFQPSGNFSCVTLKIKEQEL